MPLDLTFQIHLMMLLGLINMKNNDVIIWIRSSYFLNVLFDQQTLKMISWVESFLCPDKQGTPEEGQRIEHPKHCVLTNNNKDEDNSQKNHTHKYIILFDINIKILIINFSNCKF